jgi:hypothetical protein
MLYREIIAVCSEIRIKHTTTLFGQNVQIVNVKYGGTYSNRRDITAKEIANSLTSVYRVLSVQKKNTNVLK